MKGAIRLYFIISLSGCLPARPSITHCFSFSHYLWSSILNLVSFKSFQISSHTKHNNSGQRGMNCMNSSTCNSIVNDVELSSSLSSFIVITFIVIILSSLLVKQFVRAAAKVIFCFSRRRRDVRLTSPSCLLSDAICIVMHSFKSPTITFYFKRVATQVSELVDGDHRRAQLQKRGPDVC